MSVTAVTSLAQFKQLLSSSPRVILDCYAVWCGPCKMVAPHIDKLAAEYAGRVVFAKVDVDAAPDVARELTITAMPTIIAFKDGKAVDKVVGADKARIDALVKAL